MDEVARVIRRAALRMWLLRFVQVSVWSLSILTGLLLLVRAAERLFAFPIDWSQAWMIGLATSSVGAVGWSIATRASPLQVARAIDQGARLRESLSTALCVAGKDDAWSRAAVAQACEQARRVVIRQAIPAKPPRHWYAPLAGMAGFFILGLLPSADLLHRAARAQEQANRQAAIIQARAQVEAIEKKLEQAIARVDDDKLAEHLETPEEPASEPGTPEEIQRAAIKKLTAIQDRLAEIRAGEKGASLDAIKDRMERLRRPASGPRELDALVQAMQNGDFAKAQSELNRLTDSLRKGEMSEADRKALAEQLAKLAEQLNELADRNEELAHELEKLGLDRKLAIDPQALEKALSQAEHLSQEQKESLRKSAQACRNASRACADMASACSGAGAGLDEGLSGLLELGALADQLNALEMLQAEMDSLNAALGECASQLAALGQCNGGGNAIPNPFQKYHFAPSGRGSGNRGLGGGFAPRPEESAFDTTKLKARSPNQPGPIIGSMLVEGEHIRGESVQEFIAVATAAGSAASEAIESQSIPREYQEAVKEYFSSLQDDSPDEEPIEDDEQPKND